MINSKVLLSADLLVVLIKILGHIQIYLHKKQLAERLSSALFPSSPLPCQPNNGTSGT